MPSYFLSKKPKPAGYGFNSPANNEMATITNENIPVFQTEVQVRFPVRFISSMLTVAGH